MFRHIRSKLIAAFAVPLAILVAVAGLESVSALGQVNSVDRQTALASASVGPSGVVQALQREREFAELSIIAAAHKPASALVGLSPSAGGFNQTPADILDQTDIALSSFRSRPAAGPVPAGSRPPGSGRRSPRGRRPPTRCLA